jgi:hypothetical protein
MSSRSAIDLAEIRRSSKTVFYTQNTNGSIPWQNISIFFIVAELFMPFYGIPHTRNKLFT